MKNVIKGFLLVLIIITVSFLMPSFNFVGNSNYIKAADEDGAYTILEIVPYKGMGEMGYLVGHQEPVNKELMNIDTAADELSFQEEALAVYPSYVKSPLPDSGHVDHEWNWAETYVKKNGYFEYVGRYNGDYRYTYQTRYERVPDGTGNYNPVLDDNALQNDHTYSDSYYTKNVKAYFVYGTSSGVPLYNDYTEYDPYSVTENPTNTGDYDYDYDTGNFLLNKGRGAYDVLFEAVYYGEYYMADDYEIVEDNSGDYYCSVYYDYANRGNYRAVWGSYIFEEDTGRNASYIFVEDDEALEKPSNYFDDGNVIWVKGFEVYEEYQYTYKVELINKELFKRFSLGIPNNQLKANPVKVVTITPEELSLPENYHYLEDADFFYINANYNQDSDYIYLYEKYNLYAQSIPYEDKYSDNQNSKVDNLNFAVHDLSWDNVEKIFMRAAGIGGSKATVIFDNTFYQEAISDIDYNTNSPYDFLKKQVVISEEFTLKTATMCNMAKLYIMLDQGNPLNFYYSYMDPATSNYRITKETVGLNLTGFTGSFVRPDSSNPSPIADAAIYWNEDTFQPFGTELPDDSTEDGTEGSNFRTFKRVLNIQPTADFADSEIKIYDILDHYDVQIVNMTSTQFNGNTDNINARYDMIFMGDSKGRFNLNGGNTIFNDYSNMNNYYYFTVGDTKITNGLQVRYTGDDITVQKRSELEDYLWAGYPIVLERSLFNLSNRVKSNTNMYKFINATRYNYNNLLNVANYESTNSYTKQTFINRLNNGLNIERPILKLLEPTLDKSSPVNYVPVDSGTEFLTIKFALLPKGENSYYDAFLFLDKNGDGIFDASEEEDSISGTTLEGIRESNYITYTRQYNMSDLNGVNQWKLVVKNQDNDLIRSEITGYVTNTHKKSLYILQINENSSAYNLENRVNDSTSLIYKYTGSKLTDYNLVFRTMTVEDFQKLYDPAEGGVAYTSATAAATNKLSGYHLLLLDNPNTTINNAKGAITNIKDEVSNNFLGVICTKNALGFNNQGNYFNNTANYSFLTNNTYNSINRNSSSNTQQLYIYRNLNPSIDPYYIVNFKSDATYNTTYLTKTNEGSITRYPYQIDQAIKIAENSYSNNVTFDYNLPNDYSLSNKRLIGWYSLSDLKSPVVRSAGLYTGGVDSELYQGMYSSSPNDVRNNYYLFSNGLCFYSGIQLAAADQQYNDEEIKLFVNTIIASYQASKRNISMPPVINYIDPEPVVSGSNKTITILQEDIVGTDFILTFEITESSTNMDLHISLNGITNPEGDWDENIYEVPIVGNVSDTKIPINNFSKAIAKGTYAVKIPISILAGENKLAIKATNVKGDSVIAEVTLIYTQNPVVTFEDSFVISNGTTHCIYTDIDFNSIDADENYLEDAEELRVVFQIDKDMPPTNVMISIKSGEVDLTIGFTKNVYVRAIDNSGIESPNIDLTQTTPTGLYAMYVPMTFMKGLSSRDITIKATNISGNSGEATVTLLRRSLFPLD